MSKSCECCRVEKPLSGFSFRKDNKKYRPICKFCRANEAAASRYGVTLGFIEALAEKQGNRCAICDIHKDSIGHAAFKYNPLVVDHNHATGKVRGLLCPKCNLILGHADDSAMRLSRAAEYLSR